MDYEWAVRRTTRLGGRVGRAVMAVAAVLALVTGLAIPQAVAQSVADDLSLERTTEGERVFEVGKEITFGVTVTNNGSRDATGVEITDRYGPSFKLVSADTSTGSYTFEPESGTGVWKVGTVAAGKTQTSLVTLLVVSLDTRVVISSISAVDEPDVPELADVSLEMSVSDSSPEVDDEVTFTIEVINEGPADATGVEVGVQRVSGYQYTFSNSGGSFGPSRTSLSVGDLPAGAAATLEIRARVLESGDYQSRAQVVAMDQPDIDSAPNNDDGDQSEDDEDNAVTVPVPRQERVDLELRMSVDDSTPTVGDQVTFTIEVSNFGDADATGIEIRSQLASGYQFATYNSTAGHWNPFNGSWDVGSLAAGSVETVDIAATVLESGDYQNRAQVVAVDQRDIDSSPDNEDGDASEDDEDTVLTEPRQERGDRIDLGLTKSVDRANPRVGDAVAFTLTLTNEGPSDATGVAVVDQLPSGYSYVSSSSGIGFYDPASGVWTVGGLPRGESSVLIITAMVSASGDYTNVAQVSTADQADVDSVPGNNVSNEDDQDQAQTQPVPVADAPDDDEPVDPAPLPTVAPTEPPEVADPGDAADEPVEGEDAGVDPGDATDEPVEAKDAQDELAEDRDDTDEPAADEDAGQAADQPDQPDEPAESGDPASSTEPDTTRDPGPTAEPAVAEVTEEVDEAAEVAAAQTSPITIEGQTSPNLGLVAFILLVAGGLVLAGVSYRRRQGQGSS